MSRGKLLFILIGIRSFAPITFLAEDYISCYYTPLNMDTGDPPHIVLLLISLLALFLLSMFFSSAETAFLSLNKLKLRFLRERNNKAAARAEKILQNKQKFLSTILIGNSIVNIAISVVLTAAALRIFGDAGLGIAVAAGTVLLLIFGEILPKSIALVYPDALSLAFARFILLVMAILSPAVKLFSAVTGVLLRLCGIREAQNTAAVTEADLREFFQAREEGGFIGSDERTLLTNILRYGDFSVRSVMTPRRDIAAIHIGATAAEIIELSKKSRFSRFPVYSTNIDDIQGFFYIKDFLFSPEYLDGSAAFQVSAYLRKPLFVFETAKLAQVEKKFHTEQQTMAIVLDEYGGTAGLITVEDVSEEIFGSILDEYDVRENAVEPNAAAQTAGTLQAVSAVQADKLLYASSAVQANTAGQTGTAAESGRAGQLLQSEQIGTPQTGQPAALSEEANSASVNALKTIPCFIAGVTRLSDLNEQLNLNLESEYSDTIGGYIMEKAGEIPSAGYSVGIEPYLFTVTKVEANRIVQIEVRMQAEA